MKPSKKELQRDLNFIIDFWKENRSRDEGFIAELAGYVAKQGGFDLKWEGAPQRPSASQIKPGANVALLDLIDRMADLPRVPGNYSEGLNTLSQRIVHSLRKGHPSSAMKDGYYVDAEGTVVILDEDEMLEKNVPPAQTATKKKRRLADESVAPYPPITNVETVPKKKNKFLDELFPTPYYNPTIEQLFEDLEQRER